MRHSEDAFLDELGAGHFVFRGMNAALRWYIDKQQSETSLEAPLDAGTVPRNQDNANRARATMAKIAYCLRSEREDGEECGLAHADKILKWAVGWDAPETLAKMWSFGSVEALHESMELAEDMLIARMRRHGLLAERATSQRSSP